MKRWLSYLLLIVTLGSTVSGVWGMTIWDENGIAPIGLTLTIVGFIVGISGAIILGFKDKFVFGILCVIIFYVVTIALIVGGVIILINCLLNQDAGLAFFGIVLLQLGFLLSFGPWVNFFISLAELLAAAVFFVIFFISFSGTSFFWMIVFGIPGFFGLAITSNKLTPSTSYTPIGKQKTVTQIIGMQDGKQEKEASVVKRGIVGYVIGGPAGAMIGALSAVDKNNRMRNK